MIRWTLFWTAALSVALLANYAASDDAMAKCQLTHSYDTCFQLLNR